MVKALFGKFERSLDEKGRLLLPAKLLLTEGIDSLYVLRGFDGCLSVYQEDAFEALIAELQSMDFRDEEQRAYIRLAASSVSEMKLDSHGRILLGRDLLREYGMGQDVTLIGCLDHFEIWDQKAYARYLLAHGAAFDNGGKAKKGSLS